jgi:hypothetical protein
MQAQNNAKFNLPLRPRPEPQDRTEIHSQLRHMSGETASEEAANNLRFAAHSQIDGPSHEAGGIVPLEASGRDQDEAIPDAAQQSSDLSMSNSDPPSPAGPDQPVLLAKNDPRDAGLEATLEVDEDGEANGPENPSPALQGTRWITQQGLVGLISAGVTIYQSEVTDALFLLDRGEKVWVVDKNGDCVIAQDQSLE